MIKWRKKAERRGRSFCQPKTIFALTGDNAVLGKTKIHRYIFSIEQVNELLLNFKLFNYDECVEKMCLWGNSFIRTES